MDIVIASIEDGSNQLRSEAQAMLRELRESMGVINYGKEYLNN